MSDIKKAIYFLLSNFLCLSVILNFRCGGEIINTLFCNSTVKEFLPDELQNIGFSCAGVLPKCTGESRYYSIDGSCNNMLHPRWGTVGSPYARLVAAEYSDGAMKFRKSLDGSPLPNPREMSTTIFTDKNILSNNFNILFYGLAQWATHDMSLSVPQVSTISCCEGTKPKLNTPEELCMPVHPPINDYFYSKFQVTCIDSKRSLNTADLGCPLKPIHQINFQTSWLDLSLVYGPSKLLTNALRTFQGGRLRVGLVKQPSGQNFPEIIPLGCPAGGLFPTPGASCMATGDIRLLQNTELTVNEVTLFRMHNHIASGLHKVNPHWNDEKLFNEARKLLIAKYQVTVYGEVIPSIIGPSMAESFKLTPQKSGYVKGYNPAINGQVLAEFSATVGRILHSMVRGSTIYKDAAGQLKTYHLKDKYFNQHFLLEGNTFTNVIQSFRKSQCGAQDQFLTTEITNHLFISASKAFGQDIVAVDINRGRDFGVASYNAYRKACGLCRVNSFKELYSELINPTINVPHLERFYKHVDDIDLYVGGILEKPVPGGVLGPTMACLMAESFHRAKFGDRLFYDLESSGFTLPQLQDIRKTTYAQFLCLTNNISTISKHSLRVPSPTNPEVPCSFFGDTDYNLYKDIII